MKKLVVTVFTVFVMFMLIFQTSSRAAVLKDKSEYEQFMLSSVATVNTDSPHTLSFVKSPLSVANIIDKIARLFETIGLLLNRCIAIILNTLTEMSINAIEKSEQSQQVNTQTTEEPQNAFLSGLVNLLGKIVAKTAQTQDNDTNPMDKFEYFTIQDLLLGEYEVLDINLINADKTSNYWLKPSVQMFYTLCTRISMVISLFSLIYVGIRMAISTIADDKAKYKTMLINWFVGFIMLFLFKYIAIALIELSNMLTNILKIFFDSSQQGLETAILDKLQASIEDNSAWAGFTDVIIWIIIVIYQFSFFWKYFMRMLKFAFLMMISPLITITYSIDKIGDKKAQIFSSWLKQLISLIFMPVIHAFIYLFFMVSAGEIMKVAPILAIIMLLSLSKGEQIVLKTLKLNVDEDGGIRKFFGKKGK